MSHNRTFRGLLGVTLCLQLAGCAVGPIESLPDEDQRDRTDEAVSESPAEPIEDAEEALGFGTTGLIKIDINTQDGWFKKANGATCVLEVSYHQCYACGYTNKETFYATSSNGVCSFSKVYSWPYTVTDFIAAGSATYKGKTLLTGKKTGHVAPSGWNAGLISTNWTLTF